ncbi:MAG: ATP--guanido phosphotransferase [Clostridia bacterium]|nr:ATP--guanido phosphotransferase [Clostridia bacterium]
MAWYQIKGAEADTVISSRIRLARNINGYAFGNKLTDEQAKKILSELNEALGADFIRTDMDTLSPTAARALVEQHFISPEFAVQKNPRALFRCDNKSLYVMGCEEDHIRLQCILPGLALQDAYRFAVACDETLDATLDIAFDEKLGYLTHCPTNLGTGMRASVMLFLPALTEHRMIASLSHQLSKIGLTMRGMYGEGSAAHGCLYQISNQITLGLSEEDILHKLEETVQNIINKERELRSRVAGEAALIREDRIHRAEGILRYATRISSEEFFSLYKELKLGIAEGIITSISAETLNALLIAVMPAQLVQNEVDPPKSSAERDALRATFIKKALEVKPHG